MSYIKSQVDRGSTMLVRVEHGRHTNITAPTLYSGRRASVAFGAQKADNTTDEEFARWVAARHMILFRIMRHIKREGVDKVKLEMLADSDKQDWKRQSQGKTKNSKTT